MTRLTCVLLTFAIAFGASGCGNDEPQPATRPSSPVKVAILEPSIGAVLSGDTLRVKVKLDGGTIVEEASRDLTPTTEGHLHVSVDGAILSQTYGLSQSLEMPDPGKHLLQVEFVAKDHGPFDPRIVASAPFEVTSK